jgi:hypothetical protein
MKSIKLIATILLCAVLAGCAAPPPNYPAELTDEPVTLSVYAEKAAEVIKAADFSALPIISVVRPDPYQNNTGTLYEKDYFVERLPDEMEVGEVSLLDIQGFVTIMLSYYINDVRFNVKYTDDGIISETYKDEIYTYVISKDGAETSLQVVRVDDTEKGISDPMRYWFVGANTPEDMINS